MRSNNFTPQLRNNPQQGKDRLRQSAKEEMGLKTIAELQMYMRADASRMERNWEPTTEGIESPGEKKEAADAPPAGGVPAAIQAAADKYEANLAGFTSCLRFLANATTDDECPASAPMRQNWLNEEGRFSGSS